MTMDKPTARPPDVVADDEVLDGTDPHAGDDADWESHQPAAPVVTPEPSPLLFWKGLLLGLLVAAAMWGVLALVAIALYKTLID
jgi:hypothetical protein